MFNNVARWDAPDQGHFVIRMKKAQPTFLEKISSFSVPIVIVPAEIRTIPRCSCGSSAPGRGSWSISCPAVSEAEAL